MKIKWYHKDQITCFFSSTERKIKNNGDRVDSSWTPAKYLIYWLNETLHEKLNPSELYSKHCITNQNQVNQIWTKASKCTETDHKRVPNWSSGIYTATNFT